MSSAPRVTTPEPTFFAELFTPKLISVLREGYDAGKLRADALVRYAPSVADARMTARHEVRAEA